MLVARPAGPRNGDAEARRQGGFSGERTDRYGRSVRTVRGNGEDVADAMVGAWLARGCGGSGGKGWC